MLTILLAVISILVAFYLLIKACELSTWVASVVSHILLSLFLGLFFFGNLMYPQTDNPPGESERPKED